MPWPGAHQRSRPGRARWPWLLATAVVLAAGAIAWQCRPAREPSPEPSTDTPAPPNPQLTYQGVFQNVHPDVGYVGDAVCARCHKDIARSYQASGMGKSMAPIAAVAAQQPYGADH